MQCVQEETHKWEELPDSKRWVKLLKVPWVYWFLMTLRLHFLANTWVFLRILSQEPKRNFTSYLYESTEQGCPSHWRSRPILFSAPLNLLWEPALLISCCGLKCLCQQGKETFIQLGSNSVAEEIQTTSGAFISGMVQASTTTVQLMGCKKPGLKNRSFEKKMDVQLPGTQSAGAGAAPT